MIFDITRRVAAVSKAAAQGAIHKFPKNSMSPEEEHFFGGHIPRIIHGITLVTGGALAGFAYEILNRPWDVARRTIELERTLHPTHKHPFFALVQKIRGDGITHFFHDHGPSTMGSERTTVRRRILSVLRTIGRVGPWGVGFLVWEAFGPGLP